MSTPTGEIITIQSGHYANFVGAHWWNLQQAAFCFDPKVSVEDNCINHDVLFREGRTLAGEFTYTPRLIAFEVKESMGTLRKEGILYDSPKAPSSILWQNEVEVSQSKAASRNQFLKDLAIEDGIEVDVPGDDISKREDASEIVERMEVYDNQMPVKKKYALDNCVSVWSDYLKVHFHPKTMCLIERNLSSEEETCSDSILQGRGLVHGSLADEIEDKIHYFSEECDHLQAFQLFIDPYDRFAGVSTKALELIADDYSAKSVLSIALNPCTYNNDSVLASQHRILSTLIGYTMIHDHTSLLLPVSCSTSPWRNPRTAVSMPFVDYKSDLNYHTSAILAGMLDTATLSLRSKAEPIHVRDVCSSLNYHSRKIASVVGCMPVPLSNDVPLLDYLMSLQTLPWYSFSSLGSEAKTDPQIQQIVIRGTSGSLMKKSNYQDLSSMLSQCHNSSDILSLYLKDSMPDTRSLVRSFNPPINCSDPFPHIFGKKIGVNGTVCLEDRDENLGVNSVPMMAGLQSHSEMGQHLKSLVQEVKSINIKRIGNFFDESFEVDDFNESVEKMLTIIDDYPCQEMSDSDSDNDDA